ncbi:hypothetical protein BDP27DRAFT_1433705 [Rhodocollybia butyracea]|uniref:Uncharacterized protein n=1 Tax=Rhodocollybia butyracea TaxID=206335 RepID=A0A9P5P486_9AGAR|nr:hypothetical protein BDP27DRAFT_1433705 [Rhodocollybia butyracea]
MSEGSTQTPTCATGANLCTHKYGRQARRAVAASTVGRVSSITTIEQVSSVETVECVSSTTTLEASRGSSPVATQRVSSVTTVERISSIVKSVLYNSFQRTPRLSSSTVDEEEASPGGAPISSSIPPSSKSSRCKEGPSTTTSSKSSKRKEISSVDKLPTVQSSKRIEPVKLLLPPRPSTTSESPRKHSTPLVYIDKRPARLESSSPRNDTPASIDGDAIPPSAPSQSAKPKPSAKPTPSRNNVTRKAPYWKSTEKERELLCSKVREVRGRNGVLSAQVNVEKARADALQSQVRSLEENVTKVTDEFRGVAGRANDLETKLVLRKKAKERFFVSANLVIVSQASSIFPELAAPARQDYLPSMVLYPISIPRRCVRTKLWRRALFAINGNRSSAGLVTAGKPGSANSWWYDIHSPTDFLAHLQQQVYEALFRISNLVQDLASERISDSPILSAICSVWNNALCGALHSIGNSGSARSAPVPEKFGSPEPEPVAGPLSRPNYTPLPNPGKGTSSTVTWEDAKSEGEEQNELVAPNSEISYVPSSENLLFT